MSNANDLAAREVEWYRNHGKYPHRIHTTRSGFCFVIGDWDWNRKRKNTDKQEIIEPEMIKALLR